MTTSNSLMHIVKVFAFRSIGMLSAFALNFIAALKLPPSEAGLFFIGNTLIVFLALSGRVGADNLLVKTFSIEKRFDGNSEAIKLYSFAIKKLGTVLIFFSFSLLVFSDYLSVYVFNKPELALTLKLFSPSIVFYGINLINTQALLGLRKTNQSILLANITPPIITASIIFISNDSSSTHAAFAFSCASFVSLTFSFLLLPFNPLSTIKIKCPVYWSQCFPFFWASISSQLVLWTGQLVGGAFTTSEEVAQLTIALRISMLVSFPLLVANAIYSPLFAKNHNDRNHKTLKEVAQQASALSLAVASPILLVCIIVPEQLMSFFGESYKDGAPLLFVLIIGQTVNVSCGSVGQLLMMCGKERTFRNLTIISGTISILLATSLTPIFGILGAAIATSASISILNITAAKAIKSSFGFWVFPRIKFS